MEQKKQSQSLLSGAMLLMFTTTIVHIIGVLYKIPITGVIGEVGRGYFTSAYEIYTPLYAISMAGLPVAVSKMVSERMATGRYREVRQVREASKRVFLVTGLVGTTLLLLLAYPFSHYIIKSPNAFYSILAIAPSIFFCCMMSTFRGYYEGLRNMAPTGISQVIETVGKLVFGLVLAKIVQIEGRSQFASTGTVFGTPCVTESDVFFATAPYSAAAAIFGVTLGTVVALIYLFIKHKLHGDGITEAELLTSPESDSVGSLTKILVRTAVPIATSSLVLNITNLIDSVTVQSRLKEAVALNVGVIRDMYPEISASGIPDNLIKDFLYGCYGVALDFRGLIPTVIMTLGVSAIPVLSAAWATRETDKAQAAIHSVVKTATLLAVPAGFCMAVLSEPILQAMYLGTNSTSTITIAAPYVAVFGYFAILLAISTPITNMLQAVGRADVPVKSLLVGASVKIICNYILVGNPEINIKGAPIGTVLCYAVIVSHNLYVLLKETGVHLKWFDCFVKPFLVGALSGGAAYLVYNLGVMYLPMGDMNSRLNGSTVSCVIALVFAIIIWLLLLLIFRVMSKSDILMLPKGEKIAKTLEKRGLIR